MAGLLHLGELKRRLHCAEASAEDDAAIRRLLRENPMGGAIQLTFEREPDYFRGGDLAGGRDRTIVVWENDQLACVGRCARRQGWVNGHARAVGYLGELRLDHRVRGHGRFLRRGYEFFHSIEAADPADLYFTAIASDNLRARRVLEGGMRGLPRYDFLGELTTLLIAVPRRAIPPSVRVEPASPESLPDVLRVLNQHAQRAQLATVWTEERLLGLARHGLSLRRFHLVYRGAVPVACGAFWDQRAFRQTVIQQYTRPLAIARPALNLLARLLRRPCLPPPGSTLPHAFLSPLGCAEDDLPALEALVASFAVDAKASGVDFLTLAFPSDDPRLRSLKARYQTRAWASRLYQVTWPDQPGIPLDRAIPLVPDLALL